jgi:hypothetical protein
MFPQGCSTEKKPEVSNMKLKTLAAAMVLVAAAPAFAVDGIFGTTSTGSTDITANIGNLVNITQVDDPIVLAPNALGDLEHDDEICLFRNGNDDQDVSLLFTSANGAGTFELTDGINPNVPYSVTVGLVGGASFGPATEGTALTATGGTDNLPDCTASTGGVNVHYTLNIPVGVIQSTTAGTYIDTLTILVTPI